MTASTTTRPPIGCPRCDARWGGLNTAHCSACHLTFTGITAFDKHRTGSHAASTRRCMTPEDAGLVLTSRAYTCYGMPGEYVRPDDDEGK